MGEGFLKTNWVGRKTVRLNVEHRTSNVQHRREGDGFIIHGEGGVGQCLEEERRLGRDTGFGETLLLLEKEAGAKRSFENELGWELWVLGEWVAGRF